MAKYRNLQTKFWVDPFIVSLTPEQKFIYIYWLTNPYCTQCGIYEITKRQMSFDTGYNVDTIEKFISFFEDSGKIKYSNTTSELCLINFIKHNSNNSPKVLSCIKRELSEVKDKELIPYLYHIDTISIPYGYGMDTVSQEKEKEKEKKEEKEKREEEENKDDSLPPSLLNIEEENQNINNDIIVERLESYIGAEYKGGHLFKLLESIIDVSGETTSELIERFAVEFWINKEYRGVDKGKSKSEKYRVINSFKKWVEVEKDFQSGKKKITSKQKIEYEDDIKEIFDFYSKRTYRIIGEDAKEKFFKSILKILQSGETKENFKNIIDKGADISSHWKDIENIVYKFYDLKKILTA